MTRYPAEFAETPSFMQNVGVGLSEATKLSALDTGL